jgi:uncharacterized linocin/CFP29 family protein
MIKSISSFWENLKKNKNEHIFNKNKNLVFFGGLMNERSYDHIKQKIEKLGVNPDLMHQFNVFKKIISEENGKEEKLKGLAKKAVEIAFGIPENIMVLDLNEGQVDLNRQEPVQVEYDSLDKEMKDLINKRILLNCMIQGSSIHAFTTIHHIVGKELEEIISGITRLYDEFALGSLYSYWENDYSKFAKNVDLSQQIAIGSCKIEYQNEDDISVICKAKSFPVLCQEMVKGGMELICLHAMKDIPADKIKIIYQFADQRFDEPKYIQVGSEIWRVFLKFNSEYNKVFSKKSCSELVMYLSLMDTQDLEDFFENMLDENNEKCFEIISKYSFEN